MAEWSERVDRVMKNQPTVLQLVAQEIGEDVANVTADLAGREADKPADVAYRGWQNGMLGGQIGRFGGIFTPTVAGGLRDLLLAVDGGDASAVAKAADELARDFRVARRASRD
jgi:hypothetical protein